METTHQAVDACIDLEGDDGILGAVVNLELAPHCTHTDDDTEEADDYTADDGCLVGEEQRVTFSQAHNGIEAAIKDCQRCSVLMRHTPALQGLKDALEEHEVSKQKQPSILDKLR